MSCLAHVFEAADALDKLEAFASLNGPAHYGLEPNAETVTLIKDEAPASYPSHLVVGEDKVTVFDPGFDLFWRVE